MDTLVLRDQQAALKMKSATVADGATAATITLAMSFDLIVPKMAVEFFCDRRAKT